MREGVLKNINNCELQFSTMQKDCKSQRNQKHINKVLKLNLYDNVAKSVNFFTLSRFLVQ